jgi:hypothetical protein
MRTMFGEIHLFNDETFRMNNYFIQREKEKDRGGERKREKVRDAVWLEKGCGVGHKLDFWLRLCGLRNRIHLAVNLNAFQDGI